jgi:membrane protein
MRSDSRARRWVGGKPYRAVRRTVLRCAGRVWHDLRFEDLYRSSKKFELMHRCLGFAALAMLTVIPLLVVIAATDPASSHGIAGWVTYGMGLTRSSAAAVTRLFSTPARVLSTTSALSVLLLAVFGVSFAGSVQAGFERIWGLPAGPWHRIWRQAVWLTVLVAYIYVQGTVGTVTQGGLAETAVRVAMAVVLGTAFFWWGLRFLLHGRVSYLAALPGAIATIACLAGLRVFSGLVFDPLIVSNAVNYGALGTVLILQSWLIGVGWIAYGGQLFGRWFYDTWLRPWAHRRSPPEEPQGGKRNEQDPATPRPDHLHGYPQDR